MKYYAKYTFRQNEKSKNAYILTSQEGEIKDLELLEYKETENAGQKYIYFGIPRNASMRRYFSHVFEGKGNKPITSTESLDAQNRTFGDSKNLGYADLFLFQFSEDMSLLTMWAVKNLGFSRTQKQTAFASWCKGESLDR